MGQLTPAGAEVLPLPLTERARQQRDRQFLRRLEQRDAQRQDLTLRAFGAKGAQVSLLNARAGDASGACRLRPKR